LGLFSLSATRGDYHYRLSLWDTAGQEMFQGLTKTYIRKKHIILICYDRSSEDSFQGLKKWQTLADKVAPEARVIIVATKADLDPVVGSDRGMQFAGGRPFIQTSALSRDGVPGLRNLLLDIADGLPRGQNRKAELVEREQK
jgi:small GTP-binding protein